MLFENVGQLLTEITESPAIEYMPTDIIYVTIQICCDTFRYVIIVNDTNHGKRCTSTINDKRKCL